MEILVSGRSLPEAYHKALVELRNKGEIVDCPAWNTTCLETAMTIHVESPLAEPMISKCFIGGPAELQQYLMEMLDGILDFEIERGNWEYTYHDRMVNYWGKDQIDFVIKELKEDPNSRRAVILIRNYRDIGSPDPACLQHIQYTIRNNKLNCYVLFRSNDACKASFMNMFALIMLQKKIADELGIKVGTYTHRANSFHCYQKDFELLNGYVKRISMCHYVSPKYTLEIDETTGLVTKVPKPSKLDCTISYTDDWKEIMEDEIDIINAKVKKLREGV